MPPRSRPLRSSLAARCWVLLVLGLGLGSVVACPEAGGAATVVAVERRAYRLAAGEAAVTLRQLSEVSGREILFAAEAVRGVRTNPVRGSFTALEAATRMLAGTVLDVTEDAKTGALAIRLRAAHPAASSSS